MKRQKFDPTKPVETRDGRPARIIATDRKGDDPIIALITGYGGDETIETYRANGRWLSNETGGADLVNVPERTIEFLNVYLDERNVLYGDYPTKAEADAGAGVGRSFALKLTREDGKIVSAELA